MSSEEVSTTKSAFAPLLALQDADLHLDQLRFRRAHLAQIGEIAELERALERLAHEASPLRALRDDLAAREEALEHETDETSARIATIETRLRGNPGSFRDQEAMANEIETLRRRLSDLEDVELGLMEELEPLDNELFAIGSRREEVQAQLAALNATLAEDQAVVDGEIASAEPDRDALRLAVPEHLRSEYDQLRAHLGGVGAARLEHGRCSGCNLALSATELDEIRHHPDELHHCEQCGRLLIS